MDRMGDIEGERPCEEAEKEKLCFHDFHGVERFT
jgi:hypothetical protein